MSHRHVSDWKPTPHLLFTDSARLCAALDVNNIVSRKHTNHKRLGNLRVLQPPTSDLATAFCPCKSSRPSWLCCCLWCHEPGVPSSQLLSRSGCEGTPFPAASLHVPTEGYSPLCDVCAACRLQGMPQAACPICIAVLSTSHQGFYAGISAFNALLDHSALRMAHG